MKTVLQFSGGKDSLACLYLNRDRLSELDVMFADTGAVFPHVVEFVHETCDRLGARLVVVKAPESVIAYTDRVGLPVDLLPIWATDELSRFMREPPRQKFQAATMCCMAMLLRPMHEAVKAGRYTHVIRGAKKTDSRFGVAPGYTEDGVKYLAPLWDWTDAEVYDYLRDQGAPLAEHYGQANDSFDCWCCTAHLPFGDAAARIAYTKRHYPGLWPELEQRLKVVQSAMSESVNGISEVIERGMRTQ